MAKIKARDVSDKALDWAVAKCLGYNHSFANGTMYFNHPTENKAYCYDDEGHYSADWAEGGPILKNEIDRGLNLYGTGTEYAATYYNIDRYKDGSDGSEPDDGNSFTRLGPTPLIAAMRCFVTSQLGEEIEVPDELLQESSARKALKP